MTQEQADRIAVLTRLSHTSETEEDLSKALDIPLERIAYAASWLERNGLGTCMYSPTYIVCTNIKGRQLLKRLEKVLEKFN